jgi:hypothetical protein
MRRYTHTQSQTRQLIQALKQYISQWSRVLRSGGSNHSKPLCVLVFFLHSNDQAKRSQDSGRVHSATRPEIYSPIFGALGRGLGIRFLLDSLPKHDGADRRTPRRDFGRLCGGGISCFLHTAGSQSPDTNHSYCARRTTAHGSANISDSIKGVSEGVVSSQGVVATPSKLHGFIRSHEAVAGRRRPAAQYGAFYLDQVEGAVITAPTRGISIGALALSKGRADQRSLGRTQPQACGRGCPGI